MHRLRTIAWLIALLIPAAVAAHNLPYSLASVAFPGPSVARIEIRCHLIPLILGEPQGTPTAEMIERFDRLDAASLSARERDVAAHLLAGFSLRADAHLVDDIHWAFPSYRVIAADAAAPQYNATPSPPLVLIARIPVNARTVDVALPPQLGSAVLTVRTPAGRQYSEPLSDGSQSNPIELRATSGWPAWPGTLLRFILLGFRHIVPAGLDHILFIVALAISTPRLVELLKLATAFTLAHSITLSLAALGIARLPPSVVEPAIAVSIAIVAILSITKPERKVRADRIALVFLFGLLHGMGFASALQETGLPRGQELPALAGFNLGIECGQVAVILVVLLLVGAWRDRSFYRARIANPVNAGIALVGLFWAVQRVVE